jgi:hypothetical protein
LGEGGEEAGREGLSQNSRTARYFARLIHFLPSQGTTTKNNIAINPARQKRRSANAKTP